MEWCDEFGVNDESNITHHWWTQCVLCSGGGKTENESTIKTHIRDFYEKN